MHQLMLKSRSGIIRMHFQCMAEWVYHSKNSIGCFDRTSPWCLSITIRIYITDHWQECKTTTRESNYWQDTWKSRRDPPHHGNHAGTSAATRSRWSFNECLLSLPHAWWACTNSIKNKVTRLVVSYIRNPWGPGNMNVYIYATQATIKQMV